MSTLDSKAMYTIIVSGVTFTLSEASIRSDSPDTNLLAMSLLGDFAEAGERTLVLDRDATTFKLIRDHLAGYTVFPIGEKDHPGMDRSKFLRYLQEDCDYYGLESLKEALKRDHNASSPKSSILIADLISERPEESISVDLAAYQVQVQKKKEQLDMLNKLLRDTAGNNCYPYGYVRCPDTSRPHLLKRAEEIYKDLMLLLDSPLAK